GEDPGTDPGEDPGTDPGDDPVAELGATVEHAERTAGQQQTVVGTGFEPGEKVTGLMNSTPLELGIRTADADGTVTFTWTIPTGTDAGEHTVTLTGETSGAVSVRFRVLADGLAATGHEPGPGVPIALVLIVLGGVAIAGARMRMLARRS